MSEKIKQIIDNIMKDHPFIVDKEEDGEGTKVLRRLADGSIIDETPSSKKVPELVRKVLGAYEITSDLNKIAEFAGVPPIMAHRVLRNYGYSTQYRKKL